MRGNVSFGGGEKKEVTITAEAAPIVVTPQSGQVFSKVTVNPTATEAQKTITPSSSVQTVAPNDSTKHLSTVKVNAVSASTLSVTATGSTQTKNPGANNYYSTVTVQPVPINLMKYTNVRSFWNDSDDQAQAETKTYTNNLTAGYYYLLVIVSASTGTHSSTFSYTGTSTNIFNVNVGNGNGLRIALIRAQTAGTLTITVKAKSQGARNATGCALWRIYWQ